jgi:hypothetical protein
VAATVTPAQEAKLAADPSVARIFPDLPISAGPGDLRTALGVDLSTEPAYVEHVARLDQPGYYPGWSPAEAMACGDYGALSEARYLSLDGDTIKVYRYTSGIPHIVFATLNPHHRDFLRYHFGRHLVYYLARFLFRPAPRTTARVILTWAMSPLSGASNITNASCASSSVPIHGFC